MNSYYITIVVVLLILIFFYFRYRSSGSSKNAKTEALKKNKQKPKSAKRSDNPKNSQNNDDEDEADEIENGDDESSESEEGEKQEVNKNVVGDAERLYNNIHDRMANGMKKEEFLDAAGDMVDKYIYIELRQVYNDSKSKGMDPSKAVTVKDYAKVLNDAIEDS